MSDTMLGFLIGLLCVGLGCYIGYVVGYHEALKYATKRVEDVFGDKS